MTLQPHNPPHPGALIKRTYIEPFDAVTAAAIARELAVSKGTFIGWQRLFELVNISPSWMASLQILDAGKTDRKKILCGICWRETDSPVCKCETPQPQKFAAEPAAKDLQLELFEQ